MTKCQGNHSIVRVCTLAATIALTGLLLLAGGISRAQSFLTASDGASSDYFGNAISVSGNTLAVGAPFHTANDNVWQGAVYIYTMENGIWTQQAGLTAPDGGQQGRFGTCVVLKGNTLVVGAVARANFTSGAVYVYKNLGTTWTLQAELTAADVSELDFFGLSADLQGDTLVVGAAGKDR